MLFWEFPGSPVVRTPGRSHCPGVQSLVGELKSHKLHSMAKKNLPKTETTNVCCFICSHPLPPFWVKEPLYPLGNACHMGQGGSSRLPLFPLLSPGQSGYQERVSDQSKTSRSSLKFMDPEEVTLCLSGPSANWSFLKKKPTGRKGLLNQEEHRLSNK